MVEQRYFLPSVAEALGYLFPKGGRIIFPPPDGLDERLLHSFATAGLSAARRAITASLCSEGASGQCHKHHDTHNNRAKSFHALLLSEKSESMLRDG